VFEFPEQLKALIYPVPTSVLTMSDEKPQTMEFDANISWDGGKDGTVTVEDKQAILISSPAHWGGNPTVYSPHDLFVSAIAGCYITTFATMMQRMKQPLKAHNVSGRGILTKHPEGGWDFTDIYVTMEITIPKDANLSQVKRAVELTEKYCHISRSVKCKMHVEPKITQLD
jgi:peroxiredoxin-like protein